MRGVLAAAVLASACQNNPSKLDDKPGQSLVPPVDAGITFTNPHGPPKPVKPVAPTDWELCDAALKASPKVPAMRRVQQIVASCKPCGEWKPLLDWNTEPKDGGPKRTDIEDAMLACKGYCNPDAKQRFLGTLDQLRGKGTRGPWRFLGEICKAEVSAVPDNRYAGAVWFALDRISRAAAARPDSAALLQAIDLPLPVISVSGFGYDLAHSPMTAPDVGPIALTVTPNEIRVAAVPHARLGKDGVTVAYKGEPYPGVAVTNAKDLAEGIAKLEGETPAPPIHASSSIAIFAPRAMPAVRLLEALKITGERPLPPPSLKATWPHKGDVRLAVTIDGGLPGWATSGSIPIALRTTAYSEVVTIELGDNPDPAIEELKKQKTKLLAILAKIRALPSGDPAGPSPLVLNPALVVVLSPTAKVEGLAKLLGATGFFDVRSVALVAGKAKPGP